MSTVNKYNYEAVLLDFVEGRLSASETDALFDFLAAHPELQEDFDSALEMFTLQENEAVVFAPKDQLLQDESLDAKQSLIIAQLENVASQEETEKLQILLKEDKTTQQEYAIFSKMKLQEDERIVFAGKEGLIQTVSISYTAWIYRASYAAAAVILLFIGFNGLNWNTDEIGTGIATTPRPKFEWPKKPDVKTDAIEFIDSEPGENKSNSNEREARPSIIETDVFIENQMAYEPIAPMSMRELGDIQLSNYHSTIDVAYVITENTFTSTKDDEPSSFVERVSLESNVLGAGLGFAENVIRKTKSGVKEYAENDHIELKFWKVHTQIRKPNWMKLNRR
jgi:hypothetical protein